jgi:C4-dicarboxylate transporter DctM subunit
LLCQLLGHWFIACLGCCLDDISTVVLRMGVVLPTVRKGGNDPLRSGIFIVIVVGMAPVTRRSASTSSCCRA